MELGTVLAQLRKQKGLNQKDFAATLGVSNGAVAMWETNKRQPDLEMIKKIASYYNVTTDFLLGYETSELTLNSISSFGDNLDSYLCEIQKKYPNIIRVSSDERELLSYYAQLSLFDKRWVMGQITNLIKEKGSTPQKKAVGK